MRKAAILAVAVGALTFAIASTAGPAGAEAPKKEPKHLLTFNRALNGAFKVAGQECSRTPGCFYYQAGPNSFSSFKHKFSIPIHLVLGTPGDPAAQTDCHRTVKMLIKKFAGLKLFYRFTTDYTCAPNVEHVVREAPRGALGSTLGD
jgi:hypothetical protein